MGSSINVLNFDNVYLSQRFYETVRTTWVDLTDLKNVNRCCELASLEQIDRRLSNARHRVTFIGSGNYHYVTLLFLRRVRVPFTLILIDNHTDMDPLLGDSLVSCGSWVTLALQTLPLLKQVILIGTADEYAAEIPLMERNRVAVFSQTQLRERPWLKYTIARTIPTQAVYISIDKDVLHDTEVFTNWDQGNLTLTELLTILYSLRRARKVWGMDVCGEYESDPLAALSSEIRYWAQKNSQVNHALLAAADNFSQAS
ncbi:MAG: arginase family protein [Firmicutes bacterium]|nr:arginase family protein [Bacillota bacterium]